MTSRHESADMQAVYTDITQDTINEKYSAQMLNSENVDRMMDRINPCRIKSRLDEEEIDREQKVENYSASITQNHGSMLSYLFGLEPLLDEEARGEVEEHKPIPVAATLTVLAELL
jgi:hypothetical protein